MPKTQIERHVVCRQGELETGQIRQFRVGGRRLAVIRLEDGTFRAISDKCPHEGASLGKGAIERMWTSEEVGEHHSCEDRVVAICPWHNFEFDVDTGLTPNVSPRLRVKTYEVELEGEDVVVYV